MTGWRAPVALVATALVLFAACGVPLDSEPQRIERSSPTSERPATTPTTNPSDSAAQVSVYFVSGEALAEVRYPVAGTPDLAEALGFALAGPAEDADPELSTAIPPGTRLIAVSVKDHLARIDLSGEINDIDGQPERTAFAQLTFTALAFREVREVRFLIEGTGVDAPTDNGNQRLVTASDYDPPLNPR